jgi:hypothetical protein
MKRWHALVMALGLTVSGTALGFCGFYVAKADAKLYNKASQIIIARDGNRTNITMVSDYQGEVKDFAMVVPVPVVLQREDVRVVDKDVLEKLDAYSAPRLVEYFDADPCVPPPPLPAPTTASPATAVTENRAQSSNALGVTIEAQYAVGEYDIIILSATQSTGLETWLVQNGYRIPAGARTALAPYIRMGMKFFVARVNLDAFDKTGFTTLRPLQISFESPDFMLPLRLGMVNAKGDQDLIVYALTRKGRVETANYRTTNIPSNAEIPEYIEKEFGGFYQALFKTAHAREGKKVAFTEYAWNTSWCDPCAAPPPNAEDLERAGAGWQKQGGGVFLTRLHLRYNKTTFKEDLMFRETNNAATHQGRYIVRRPWKGSATCEAATQYKASLAQRLEQQARTTSNLTGWKLEEVRRKMGLK